MAEITIGEYLFRRLREMGIETVFGVPGDYELALLDYVSPAGLEWIGTPNELVGAYAADGYARLKGSAALVTTFGPGELSALCGLGGSFCELVPVVHIVGYPSFAAQASGRIMHHSLGDQLSNIEHSYDHYVRMSAELSCATAILKEPKIAADEIDRVLNAMIHHSKTGYIGISEDVVLTKIPSSILDSKPLIKTLDPGPQDDDAVAAIISKLEAAKDPVIIVDGGAARGDWAAHAADLVKKLKIRHFVTVLGKGIIDETDALFCGTFAGVGSQPGAVEAIGSSDCILWLGNLPSDFNTGIFTEHVDSSVVVDLQRFHVAIADKKFQARINHVLPKLTKAIQSSRLLAARKPSEPLKTPPPPEISHKTAITQDWFWKRISSFIQPGDLIVSETGTAQFGITITKLPPGSTLWTQAVWGSIGYAIGGAVGASIAAKQTGKYRRMLVFTGEGSLQLTVQAFSILNRHGITPIVFVLNNKGYTVERYFNGWTASYNDVPDWDYGALFKAFAPDVPNVKTFKVRTVAEMDTLLSETSFQTATSPQCVDFDLDRYDAPVGIKSILNLKKKNTKENA